MEPTDEQLKGFATVSDVITFVKLDPAGTKVLAILAELGAVATTVPVLLALITEEETEKVPTPRSSSTSSRRPASGSCSTSASALRMRSHHVGRSRRRTLRSRRHWLSSSRP